MMSVSQEWLQEALRAVNPSKGGLGTVELLNISSKQGKWFQEKGALTHASRGLGSFTVNTEYNHSVITFHQSLKSFPSNEWSLADLPGILAALKESTEIKDKNISAIQFPIHLKTLGRSHCLFLTIVKQPNQTIKAIFVDSTNNPIGIGGWLGWGCSWFSGETLISKLQAMSGELKDHLDNIFGIQSQSLKVASLHTGVQPVISDKRCGVFTLNAEYRLMEYILSQPFGGAHPESEEFLNLLTAAHDELNAKPYHLSKLDAAAVSPPASVLSQSLDTRADLSTVVVEEVSEVVLAAVPVLSLGPVSQDGQLVSPDEEEWGTLSAVVPHENVSEFVIVPPAAVAAEVNQKGLSDEQRLAFVREQENILKVASLLLVGIVVISILVLIAFLVAPVTLFTLVGLTSLAAFSQTMLGFGVLYALVVTGSVGLIMTLTKVFSGFKPTSKDCYEDLSKENYCQLPRFSPHGSGGAGEAIITSRTLATARMSATKQSGRLSGFSDGEDSVECGFSVSTVSTPRYT